MLSDLGNPPTTAARLNRAEPVVRAAHPATAVIADTGPSTTLPASAHSCPSIQSQPEVPSYHDHGWEPWPIDSTNILAGDPHAHVRWLRRNGADQPFYQAGWLDMAPCVVRMLCDGLQTFLIEQGSLTIEGEDGARVRLGPGEAVSPARDTVSTWTISEPLRCFFTSSK